MAALLFQAVTKWVSLRLDVLSLLVVIITFIFITVIPQDLLSPSLMALSLVYAVNVSTSMFSMFTLN